MSDRRGTPRGSGRASRSNEEQGKVVPVATLSDLEPGQRRIVSVEGRSVLLYRLDADTVVALRNRCPHQGAEVGRGTISGTTLPGSVGEHVYGKEGQVLRCPWHAWEFDVTTGRSLHDPDRMAVRSYPVEIDGDTICVRLR